MAGSSGGKRVLQADPGAHQEAVADAQKAIRQVEDFA